MCITALGCIMSIFYNLINANRKTIRKSVRLRAEQPRAEQSWEGWVREEILGEKTGEMMQICIRNFIFFISQWLKITPKSLILKSLNFRAKNHIGKKITRAWKFKYFKEYFWHFLIYFLTLCFYERRWENWSQFFSAKLFAWQNLIFQFSCAWNSFWFSN